MRANNARRRYAYNMCAGRRAHNKRRTEKERIRVGCARAHGHCVFISFTRRIRTRAPSTTTRHDGLRGYDVRASSVSTETAAASPKPRRQNKSFRQDEMRATWSLYPYVMFCTRTYRYNVITVRCRPSIICSYFSCILL